MQTVFYLIYIAIFAHDRKIGTPILYIRFSINCICKELIKKITFIS